MKQLTETEKRVLISLHLRGHIKKCTGSMDKKQRFELLNSLVERGFLDSKTCKPTNKAHNYLKLL